MPSVDPFVVFLAGLIVALQVLAFLRTVVLARQMRSAFRSEGLQVHTQLVDGADAGGLGSPAHSARIRYHLTEPGEGGGHNRELIERINVTADIPMDVEAHIAICGEVTESMAARADARAGVMVSVPVYLGLMGTFAGIIAGLLQLSSAKEFSEVAIQSFLSGVLVAMASSLTGVLLMVVSIAIVMPRARLARDQALGLCLAGVKRALLACANESVVADRPDLTTTVATLAGSISAFTSNIAPQRQLLEMLRKLDLPNIAKANHDLLERTQPLLERLAEFEKSVASMTRALQGSESVVNGVNALMTRVSTFETSINALGHKLAVDDTVTMSTVEWIKTQIASMQARTAVVEQYVNEQDFRVKEFALKYKDSFDKLTEQASQTLVEVGERIAKEVQQSAEPERVASLMHHVATLPDILAAVKSRKDEDAKVRAQMAQSIEAVARSADRLAVAVAQLDQDSIGRSLVRWARGKTGRGATSPNGSARPGNGAPPPGHGNGRAHGSQDAQSH